MPHLLLVITHDLGRRVGGYGVPGLSTPSIDALASQGVLFEKAFATAPLCSPSRGTVMTGLYPHQHGLMGLVHRGWDLDERRPTLASLLRGNGYAAELFGGRCCSESEEGPLTGRRALLFGFQHERRDPGRLGYDELVLEKGPFSAAAVTEAFIGWLRRRAPKAPPFFACLGFMEVHRPFKDPAWPPEDPARVQVPPYLPDDPEVRRDLAEMHGPIRAVDHAMGRILQALEEAGIARDTLVLFTTDHGIAFPRAKSTLYDPGIEIALIARWPGGFNGGRRWPGLVSNVDLLPTLLDAAGRPLPAGLPGRSLLPLLRGGPVPPRGEIFAEKSWHDVYDPIRAVRTERHKYIRNFPLAEEGPRPLLVLPSDLEKSPTRQVLARLGDPHLAPRPEEELYDLSTDPREMGNLAADPASAGVLADLRARLARFMEETEDPLRNGPIPCPDPRLQLRSPKT